MAKLTDRQHEKILDANWIHASITIEVQGNDKDHVKEALEKMLARMKREKGIEIVESTYSDITKTEKGLFSYSIDVEFLARDFSILSHVALLYSPSYFEIHEPNELKIKIGDAQNILADISHIVTSLSHAVFIQQGRLKQLGAEKAKK